MTVAKGRIVNRIIDGILNVFYPRHCPVCHEILKDQGRMICKRCEKELSPVKEPRCFKCGKPVGEREEYCSDCCRTEHLYDQGRGIFIYDDKMRTSITRFKYYGCREYGDFYARAMCIYAGEEIRRWRPDLIVPVPVHRKKLKMRGFNQSAYLAEKISSFTGIPADMTLVTKPRSTKSQKKLTAHERQMNLREAFRVEKNVKGCSILVVDDVYTTGSTIDAMAHVLREKGAQKIWFLTVCIGRR